MLGQAVVSVLIKEKFLAENQGFEPLAVSLLEDLTNLVVDAE